MLHYVSNKKYISDEERKAQTRVLYPAMSVKEKEEMTVTAQAALSLLIGQNDLFPTRSLKINALVGKEFEGELVRYVGNKNIMIEARNRVLQTIIKQPAGQDDKTIDEYSSKLRQDIAKANIDILSLKDQIKYLEKKKDDKMTPLEGQGFTSLLKRLQNRLEIEKRFAPIEAASQA